MALPKIKFIIATTGLGLLGDPVQKIPGFVLTGSSVVDGITVGESHQIFSLEDAEALGITEDDNPFAHKHLTSFYNEAGRGTEMWVMLVSDATTYAQMADVNESIAKKLIQDANGKIRTLGLLKKAGEDEVITNGFDADVHAGVAKLEELAEYCAELHMPLRGVISGNKFNGVIADATDYNTAENRHVAMFIGNSDGEPEADVGLLLGRLAKIPSQRKISRVKDGAALPLAAYLTSGDKVEDLADGWDALDDKRYIFLCTKHGRSGYYFSSDKTLCRSTDDFSTMVRGFVMDEAILIAYDVLLNEQSDEVLLTADGRIHPAIVKNWQSNVETRITGLMVNEGKLSGVKCRIDPDQDILATDTMKVNLSLLGVGYAVNIDVYIGYTKNLED